MEFKIKRPFAPPIESARQRFPLPLAGCIDWGEGGSPTPPRMFVKTDNQTYLMPAWHLTFTNTKFNFLPA